MPDGVNDFRSQPVPRAASCIDGNPLFNKYSKHIGIKFNDRVLVGVVYTYNIDEGWIETLARDNRGRPKQERGKLVMIKIPGKVEAYWR